MKILPAIINVEKSISNNIKSTYSRLNMVQKTGDEIAHRASSIYKNEEHIAQYKRAAKLKKVLKEVTPYNLPIVGAIIGFISPIPGASLVLFLTGGVVGGSLVMYNKIKSHKNNADKNIIA